MLRGEAGGAIGRGGTTQSLRGKRAEAAGEARDEPFLARHVTWQHRWKAVAKRTAVSMATQRLGLIGVERWSCHPALTPLTDLATASTNES